MTVVGSARLRDASPIRSGRTGVSLEQGGVSWQHNEQVVHIPFRAVTSVSTDKAWAPRIALTIEVPGAKPGLSATFSVKARRRDVLTLAAAVRAGVDQARADGPADGRADGREVRTTQGERLALVIGPEGKALIVLALACLAQSVVLCGEGRITRAVLTWVGFLAWWALGGALVWMGSALYEPWQLCRRGRWVHARYAGDRRSSGRSYNTQNHSYASNSGKSPVYTYVDPQDGTERQHEHVPLREAATPPPTRRVWVVPGTDIADTLGGFVFTVCFSTGMFGVCVGLAGSASLVLLPGLLWI
jgi:hypothetical protein